MTVATFAVATLFAYRVNRLALVDTVFNAPRTRFKTWLLASAGRKRVGRAALFVYDLLDCQWCLGVHVAFWTLLLGALTGLIDITWSVEGVALFIALWLALAAAQSILWAVVDRVMGEKDE